MAYQFEIVGILFAFFMIYLTYVQYKRKTIGKYAIYLWAFFWFAGVILILTHRFVNAILPPLNIIRVMDLYMILSFMFLFAVVFYLYIRLNKTTSRLEELARIVTIKPQLLVKHSKKNNIKEQE